MRVPLVVPALVSVLLLGLAAVPSTADTTTSTHTVRGQVVDTAGRPVQYIHILLPDRAEDVAVATTDANGRFAVTDLWPAKHRLRAFTTDGRFVRSSGSTATVEVVDRDIDGVRLTVRRNGNVVVRAVNESGAPRAAVFPDVRQGKKIHSNHWPNTGYGLDGMTDLEQRVRASYSFLTNVPDGTYTVSGIDGTISSRKYGFRIEPRTVTVADGSSPLVTVTVHRKKRAVFTGRVLTRKGKRLAGAIVRPYSHLGSEPQDHDNSCWPAKVRTTKAGLYTFNCVDTAKPRAIISDPKWKHVAVDIRPRGRLGATTTVKKVKLKRGASVSARILSSSGSTLTRRGFLNAYLKRGKKFLPLHRVVPDVSYGGSAQVSRIRGLPAGTYRFCYTEGDGRRGTRHRDRCPKKTYKIRAGSTRTLPTVRLSR